MKEKFRDVAFRGKTRVIIQRAQEAVDLDRLRALFAGRDRGWVR